MVSHKNPDTAAQATPPILTRYAYPIAMKPQEVTDALKLNQLKDKIWFVVPSCATTGEGLLEGLAWLSNNVKTPAAPAKK